MGEQYPVNMGIGNQLNRVDVVNLTLGTVAQIGPLEVVNGFVVPLSTGGEKAFDLEYNLQVQLRL
jgi:hypothetical protein